MERATIHVDVGALDGPVDRQAAIDYETGLREFSGLESVRRDLADAVLRGVLLGIAVAVAGAGFGPLTLAPLASSDAARSGVAAPGRRLRHRRFRWTPLLSFLVVMAVFVGPYLVASALFGD